MKKAKPKDLNSKTEDSDFKKNPDHVFFSDDIPKSLKKAFLNYIQDFEEQHKNAKFISVFEFIGKPDFNLLDELGTESVSKAINNLLEIMKANNVLLDFCVDYPDDVIYRFITEEFFQHKMEDIRIPGGNICFSYEEFHPNHDYDLKRYSIEHLEILFKPESIRNHLLFYLDDNITLNDKLYNKELLADYIIVFHDLHKTVTLVDYNLCNVTFDLEANSGKAMMDFNCCLFYNDGGSTVKNETITFYYKMRYDCWILTEIKCSLF